MSSQAPLLEEIHRLVEALPREWVDVLATELAETNPSSWATLVSRLQNAMPQPGMRGRVLALLDRWHSTAPQLDPRQLALALRSAAYVVDRHRRDQVVELVWTGPESLAVPLRRTDQALLQLIHGAKHRLTIVSFAVYRIDALARALGDAAQRGVSVAMCLETPEASEGRIAYDTLRAFGPEVLRQAQVYLWPLEHRPRLPDGRHGLLHAKVAVADGESLLISSANLTEHAMTLNMEMGILLQGGKVPSSVETHFSRLIEAGVLVRAPTSK